MDLRKKILILIVRCFKPFSRSKMMTMPFATKATEFGEIRQSNDHYAVQWEVTDFSKIRKPIRLPISD